MAVYDGIYIRDSIVDMGDIPSPNVDVTASPDILCYQNQILIWADAKDSYNRADMCKPFLQDNINNIYFRAKNLSSQPRSGKLRGYYADLNMLYIPERWKPMTLNDNKTTDVDFICGKNNTIIPSGEVALIKKPFTLDALPNPNAHYCMLGLCQNMDGTWLEPPPHFNGNAELWLFLRKNPQIAYHNIVVVPYPQKHTLRKSVDFGNHDGSTCKFLINVKVVSGLDTLTDCGLDIQNTDSACPFRLEEEFRPDKDTYSLSTTLPGNYFGTLDFCCLLEHPERINCTLWVENLLILNEEKHTVISPDGELYHSASQYSEQVTHMGDFTMQITNGQSNLISNHKNNILTLSDSSKHLRHFLLND